MREIFCSNHNGPVCMGIINNLKTLLQNKEVYYFIKTLNFANRINNCEKF